MNTESLLFSQNQDNHHFEIQAGQYTAFVEYDEYSGVLALNYTYIPDKLLGMGVFQVLAKKTLDLIQIQNYKIVPVDLLIRNYINQHHEYDSLIDVSCHSRK